MEYINEKLTSLTGEALSGVNELKRKRKRQSDGQQQVEDETQIKATGANTNLYGFRQTENRAHLPPVTGIPFGGDSFTQNQPPPIGFRTDILTSTHQQSPSDKTVWHHQPESGGGLNRQARASEQSLYEGDAWARLWFQRVMILSLIRLLIFIRKVYEDIQATKTYSISGHTGHFLVATATLFLPTIVFTVYRVTRYLQIALPATRAITSSAPYQAITTTTPQKATTNSPPTKVNQTPSGVSSKGVKNANDEDDAQLRLALMDNRGTAATAGQHEDDGLVTARQTPTNLDEFHDSRSQQDLAVSPAPSTAIVKDSPPISKQNNEPSYKETVDIDKLGDIPDKATTRVVIGASEQLLHGVLFVFWQLKRQVDVMGYLVERSCLWRKPREQEKEELGRLRTGSDGLEWFQDFYAAFLAILAQVYTLGLHWSSDTPLKTSTISSAISGVGVGESSEPAISSAAKAISNAVSQQALAGNAIGGKDILIMSELLVSSAVVFSLIIAVRRRDDGPMTFGLSLLGWGSIFASRIIIIALAFVHIGWHIMLPLVFCHILGITGWIYKIAIDSHNGKKSESEEGKWDDDEGQEDNGQAIELESGSAVQGDVSNKEVIVEPPVTNQWSIMEHVVLLSQILTLFAIPSLFYWPIMFNLKMHCRPFKYLVLILSENFILIPVIWHAISSSATQGQWYLLGSVGAFSIAGFIFVSLYICCKPTLTEYFARADELFNEAEKSGIYFEFCSRVFKMPDLSKQTFRRLMNQTEQIEEI